MAEQHFFLRLAHMALVATLVVGCEWTPPSDALREIKRLEAEAFVGDSLREDIGRQLMVLYADFSRLEADHPFVPEALFRRADLLIAAKKYEHALLQLRNLHDGYPNFEKRARCAFLVAYVCDVNLKDKERARRAYEDVIVLHPKTFESQLAQQSLAAMNLN